MLVFRLSFVNYVLPLKQNKTNKHLGEGGLKQINTCRQVPLLVNFLRKADIWISVYSYIVDEDISRRLFLMEMKGQTIQIVASSRSMV
jgi:hypothetical protein